jgi:hypothetical protein
VVVLRERVSVSGRRRTELDHQLNLKCSRQALEDRQRGYGAAASKAIRDGLGDGIADLRFTRIGTPAADHLPIADCVIPVRSASSV